MAETTDWMRGAAEEILRERWECGPEERLFDHPGSANCIRRDELVALLSRHRDAEVGRLRGALQDIVRHPGFIHCGYNQAEKAAAALSSTPATARPDASELVEALQVAAQTAVAMGWSVSVNAHVRTVYEQMRAALANWEASHAE